MKSSINRVTTLTAAVALLWVGSAFAADEATPANRLNVIVILADDLGWGDLGCYGHPNFKTPNLDRMAREGARLTHFYSPAPYCAPSRAALLTGRYQFRSGMMNNPAPDAGLHHFGLPASEVTLAEAFKAAGYRTCAIGKWHLGHKPEFHPTRHGFDEYLGILYSNDMRPVELWDGEKIVEYPVVQATLTRRYTERALAFLDRNKDKPFFLYLPHAMPHKPLAASEPFHKKSGAGLYAGVMAELDWSVGEILGKLKKLGLDEKTLVFFTSDNGPWYGGSTGSLRGMKGNTWEGGIRVPLIARWPGKIPADHVSDEPAMLPDLFVTSLKAAGLPLPGDRVIDGKDILPVLTSHAKSPHDAMFSMAGQRLASVRSGKWKLHVVPPARPRKMNRDEKWIDPRAPDGVTLLAPFEQYHPSDYPGVVTGDETKTMSLFDLEADPAEQHDVAAQHPDVVERLNSLYDAMDAQVRAAMSERNHSRPKPIAQAADGTILLHAKEVNVHGTAVRYEPQPHKNTIGYWTRLEDWVSWEFEVARPGPFKVEILQGCGNGSGGSDVAFSVGNQTLTVKVVETGGFQNFIPREIGVFRIARPGVYTLAVKPRMKPGPAVMDLRSVTLRPVAN